MFPIRMRDVPYNVLFQAILAQCNDYDPSTHSRRSICGVVTNLLIQWETLLKFHRLQSQSRKPVIVHCAENATPMVMRA